MLPPTSTASSREIAMRTWFIANCLAGWFVFGLGALLLIVALCHFNAGNSFVGSLTAFYGWLYQKTWRYRGSKDATCTLSGSPDLPGVAR